MLTITLLGLVILALGYPVYRKRWPDGLWPEEDDTEKLDRVRRVGRRRVLPLPEHRTDRHQGRRNQRGHR